MGAETCLFKAPETAMKNGIATFLMAMATMLLCSVTMFAQAKQPSQQTQASPGTEAEPDAVNDKDIELLRANLRANHGDAHCLTA